MAQRVTGKPVVAVCFALAAVAMGSCVTPEQQFETERQARVKFFGDMRAIGALMRPEHVEKCRNVAELQAAPGEKYNAKSTFVAHINMTCMAYRERQGLFSQDKQVQVAVFAASAERSEGNGFLSGLSGKKNGNVVSCEIIAKNGQIISISNGKQYEQAKSNDPCHHICSERDSHKAFCR